MAETTVIAVEVRERSQVAEARRRAQDAAVRVGLCKPDAARLALVTTEAATNLLKHAKQGELLIAPSSDGAPRSVTIAAIDNGPGMTNPGDCLQDGYTTGEGPGIGLGIIRRQSDRFDVFSAAGTGTVVVATVYDRPVDDTLPPIWDSPAPTVGGLSIPAAGETACGDGWAVRDRGGLLDILVCDGLGHGAKAAEAARAAQDAFELWHGSDDLMTCLARLDTELRPTRGAAVGLATIDPVRSVVSFVGVGNIAGSLRWDGGACRTLSYEGIVGRSLGRARIIEYPYAGELLAIFASDGLGTRWDLAKYRGLAARDPVTIAAVLFRDFRRRRDDCTVVVVRLP